MVFPVKTSTPLVSSPMRSKRPRVQVVTNNITIDSEYGPVLRFDFTTIVQPANPADFPPQGEWRPLAYSSWLLSKLIPGYPCRSFTHNNRPTVWISRPTIPNPCTQGDELTAHARDVARDLARGVYGDCSSALSWDEWSRWIGPCRGRG